MNRSWTLSKYLFSECISCIIVTFIYINTYFFMQTLSNADSLTFMNLISSSQIIKRMSRIIAECQFV